MGNRSPSTEPKTLVVIRHAHRNKALGRKVDNGLSKKGRRQAAQVTEHYERVHGKAKAKVLSSPKLRCLETVEAIAKLAGTKVQPSPLLDEQGGKGRESDEAFAGRLEAFYRWWREEAPALTVACSHGDWIPLALERLTGARAELKKGGWAEIVLDDDEPRLAWLYQHFEREEP